MKVMTVFGTRPEMIKMWSTLKKLDELNFDHVMVHTGQNFTPELKDFFFSDLGLRAPDYQLDIDTSSYGREVADIISKTDELLGKVAPDAVLVLGDTFSGLAVMPAAQRGIKIYHMEAGMRAWDTRMPEQRNRILIDHMASVLLPYTPYHRENLLRENIHPSKIFVTGNPVFEALRAFQPEIEKSDATERLGLEAGKFFLVTAHRSENVDHPQTLKAIFQTLERLHETFDRDVIFPMHPRTRSRLKGLEIPDGIQVMDPLRFFDFNRLFMDSYCVISDSGTAPEEAYFHKVPCVSIRSSTERVEAVEGGAHIVAGLDPDTILEAVTTAVTQPWNGRFDLAKDFSPSSVVINVLRSQIVNHF